MRFCFLKSASFIIFFAFFIVCYVCCIWDWFITEKIPRKLTVVLLLVYQTHVPNLTLVPGFRTVLIRVSFRTGVMLTLYGGGCEHLYTSVNTHTFTHRSSVLKDGQYGPGPGFKFLGSPNSIQLQPYLYTYRRVYVMDGMF